MIRYQSNHSTVTHVEMPKPSMEIRSLVCLHQGQRQLAQKLFHNNQTFFFLFFNFHISLGQIHISNMRPDLARNVACFFKENKKIAISRNSKRRIRQLLKIKIYLKMILYV